MHKATQLIIKALLITLAITPVIAICAVEASTSLNAATLAIVNANIYTVDRNQPSAEAVLIENGVITKIGDDEYIMNGLPTSVSVTDLQGRFLMPGFQDAHLHVAEAGFNETMCVFEETQETIADYEESLLDCADNPENPGTPWVLGSGISVAEMLADKTQTPREFLDELFPVTPVLILDNVGHGAWANSQAMRNAGIDPIKPIQPQGGILLTGASGEASGELFENAQQKLRDAAFSAMDPDLSLSYDGLLKGLASVAENGITTVSDAGGYWTRNDHLLWQRAELEGQMTVRAFNALYVFPDRDLQQQIKDISALYSHSDDQFANFSLVKIYIDGILSLGTAALKEPYESRVVAALDYPRGYTYFNIDDLNTYVAEFEKAGFQAHFHVTGDRGASIALDAIANAQSKNGSQDQRHRLTHLYQIDKQDYVRFKELGVTADFQLNPSSLDTEGYQPFVEEILGAERAADLFVVRSLLDSGANVILSSDYDAGPLSPLGSISRALNRPDNSSQNVADVATAIRMTTLNVAYALHQEARTGSISVGKLADIIVLDKDITTIPSDEIAATNVLSTLLGGRVVFDKNKLFTPISSIAGKRTELD